MNIHSTTGQDDRSEKGFTLVEILIAIVLVGILAAVAVVGISNLVSKGTTSACTATADSARAASAVYLASNNKYPADFLALTSSGALTLPDNATPKPPVPGTLVETVAGSWTLTMTAGTTTVPPTFTCAYL